MGRNGAAREGVRTGRLADIPPAIDLGGTPSGGDALVFVITAVAAAIAMLIGIRLLQIGDVPAGVAMLVAGLAGAGQVAAVLAGRHTLSRLAVVAGGIAAVGFGLASLSVAGLVVVGLGAFAAGFAMASAAG